MLSWQGQLPTQSQDKDGWWKEHIEKLLNPANTSSSQQVAPKDSGEDSFISLEEITEIVKKLVSGKAPGVDEICPEMLKALDNVGLSWLTFLCSFMWRCGTVPADW